MTDSQPQTRLDTLAALTPEDVLVVVGPTASGKTELALRVAEQIGGEVVSADSVQVYRHFDLGSGKPSPAELRRASHHLINCAEPDDPFDAARFMDEADAAITSIRAAGRVPIVCGGTFLWIKALCQGLAKSAPADEALRASHRQTVEDHGNTALHCLLQAADPDAAARIHENDVLRVSRALEIRQLTGITQSEWHAKHAFKTIRYQARFVGCDHPRPELDTRIQARAEGWLEAGWIDQVAALMPRFENARAMGAVGFKQIREHLQGDLPRDQLLTAIVRATRTFVRRQRTWLRDQPVTWLDPSQIEPWLS